MSAAFRGWRHLGRVDTHGAQHGMQAWHFAASSCLSPSIDLWCRYCPDVRLQRVSRSRRDGWLHVPRSTTLSWQQARRWATAHAALRADLAWHQQGAGSSLDYIDEVESALAAEAWADASYDF